MSTTAVSIEGAAKIDEGWVMTVFRKTVEAEERVELMKKLINRRVGLAEIENFFSDLAEKSRNVRNKSRKENLIVMAMKDKYSDMILERTAWRRRKARTIKLVNRTWGLRDRKTRLLLSECRNSATELRLELEEKYENKLRHLQWKYKESKEKFILPPDLARYRDIDCFQPDYEPLPVTTAEEPLVLGDVSLDSDETEAILMDPKFMVHEDLYMEGLEYEFQCCLAKLRWNEMGREEGDEEMSAEEKEKLETLEAEQRQIFNQRLRTMDYRKYRATDAPNNATIKLPPGQTPDYEAGLGIRLREWLEGAKEYMEDHCDDKGRQRDNLTPGQRRGLKKLQKRQAEGELVIVPTDKSGRMAVMSLEAYLAAGNVHTQGDKEVDKDFVERIQRQVVGHTSAWLKILNVGQDHGHEDRHRKTFILHSLGIAQMYLTYKDHKQQDPTKPHKTRPICSAINGFNVQFSNLISPVLEALADLCENKFEVKSGENALYKIDRFNETIGTREPEFKFSSPGTVSEIEIPEDQKIKFSFESPVIISEGGADTSLVDGYVTDEGEFMTQEELEESDEQTTATGDYLEEEKVFLGSDVSALYPSCTARMAGEAVYKAILKTKLEFEGVDYRELAKYVAINCSRVEVCEAGLRRVVPVRAKQRGAKPGITGEGVMGPHKEKNDEQWLFSARFEPTDEEKKKLLAKGFQVATKALWQTHLYKFGGKIYHQKKGAPIGARASGAGARLIMNLHDEVVKEKLEKIRNMPDIAFRYVDDERFHLRGFKPGWRWDMRKESMVYRGAWLEEDTRDSLTVTQRTARELQRILESVHPELRFEMETAEDFESRTLPTLDFQCWVEGGRILYKFFSKPMAKKTQIMKTSALGENSKIASLTQEVVRRSKNTCEEVSIEERVTILNEYHRRLELSQYSLEASRRIMVAGLRGYERIRDKAARTGGNINRSEEEGAAERHKKKLLGKSNWFKKSKENDQSQERRRRRRRMTGAQEPATPVTSVLFVPKTQDSGLAKRLQEAEHRLAAITKERV